MTESTDPGARLHFCDWSAPLLPAAARLLVDHYQAAEDGVARMDGAVVALPGARAGRRLKELLAETAGEAGVRLVPPRIVTLGVLPELLYEPERPFAPELVQALAWAEALRAADRNRLSAHFAALPEARARGDGIVDWMPLARELAALARTVGAGGHRFADVADRCGRGPALGDADRWRLVARIQDDMEARLRRLGYDDRDLVRCRVAAAPGPLTPVHAGEIWLVGVAEMNPVLHRLLSRLPGERFHAVVHGPGARAADFDALGCIRPDVWSAPERHLALRDDQIHVADRPGDQADLVVRILADLDGGFSSEEIALGVPDPQVVPALEERMERSGVSVRDAAGRPLSRTGPVRLLEAVAEFLPERRYDGLAGLVRHPDLAPWLGAPDVRIRRERNRDLGWLPALDRWYGQHLPARMPAPERGQEAAPWPTRRYPGLDVEKGSDEGRVVRQLLARLDDLLMPLGGTRPLSRWPEAILEFLATVYAVHERSPTTPRGRRLIRSLEKLREAADAFTALPPSLSFDCDGTTALRLLVQGCRGESIPLTPDEDAVEMLGWLELHLDDTPVTVVTGVNEGSLPDSVRGDAFLPDSLRSRLGLEDDRHRYARDLYRMTAILASREVLHLVAGRRSTAGDPLRPSRLLFAADDGTVARRVRRFFGGADAEAGPDTGPDTGEEPPAAGAGIGERAPTRRPSDAPAFRLPPEPIFHPGDSIRTVSVTEFRQLLDDPWSWALGRLHRAEPENDHGVEMDGAVFGSLAHDVLERFGKSEVERHAGGEFLTEPAAVWAALEAELDRQVAGRFGPRAVRARVAVRLQVEQLRSRLRAFAEWHARRTGAGWRVKAVELSTPDGGVPFPWGDDGRSVGLKARIDRVDLHPETGQWAVFDYKTGDNGHDPEKTHRKGRGDAKEWIDLQLPLYHWLLPRVLDEAADLLDQPDRLEVGFILLPRERDRVGESMARWDAGVLASGIDRARELLAEHLAGPIPFAEGRRPRWPDPEMQALTGRSVLEWSGPDDQEETP